MNESNESKLKPVSVINTRLISEMQSTKTTTKMKSAEALISREDIVAPIDRENAEAVIEVNSIHIYPIPKIIYQAP